MRDVRDFFAEFSAGETLQQGAKSALTSFFQTVLGWATKAMHAVHVGFLEIQIGALRVYIFAAPLVRLMRELWSNALVLRGFKVLLGSPARGRWTARRRGGCPVVGHGRDVRWACRGGAGYVIGDPQIPRLAR
jgi:hypothetical protein